MHLTWPIDPCLYKMTMPVRVQFQTGWATFVAMKDACDQCLYRSHVDVVREVLQARDILIGLEKVALHPALNEEWKVVSDLNVGIVKALKLKQLTVVALFIARRLGKATASEKDGPIRTARAQLKEFKAMGGRGGFVEFANWVIPPPSPRFGLGSATRASPSLHHVSSGFEEEGRGGSSGAGDFSSTCMGEAYGVGAGHVSGGPGHYGPTNGRFHRGRGGWDGRGGRGGSSGLALAVCRKCTLAGSTFTNHPHTMCPLNECFKCGRSGHIRQFCPN